MNVKVYSTPTCPWCKKAKDYLASRNVPYEDYNVVSDRTAREEMINLSGQQGVPVIAIDNNVVLGFDKDAIDNFIH